MSYNADEFVEEGGWGIVAALFRDGIDGINGDQEVARFEWGAARRRQDGARGNALRLR